MIYPLIVALIAFGLGCAGLYYRHKKRFGASMACSFFGALLAVGALISLGIGQAALL